MRGSARRTFSTTIRSSVARARLCRPAVKVPWSRSTRRWIGLPRHRHRISHSWRSSGSALPTVRMLPLKEDRALYADQPKQLQHFYGEITGMDRAFGKLRDALGDLGIRENTILWYCSDNGALPKVGSAGTYRGNKGQVYEGGLLVPAILEWPARIRSPRHTRVRCNTCDIYPDVARNRGSDGRTTTGSGWHQPGAD